MHKFNKLVAVFSDIAGSFGNKPLLVSIRRGLAYMIPLVLLGSIALIFISLPIPAYQNLMGKAFGSNWKELFLSVRDGTFNILSIIMVICISYSYIVEHSKGKSQNLSAIIAATVSLGSFIAVSGISKEGFNIANFGVIGLFVAILVAVSSSMLYLKLSSINALKIRVFTDGANSVFNHSLISIFPAAITIIVFAIINQVMTAALGISDIQSFISDFFSNAFVNIISPFWSALLFVGLIHIFWFLGMHGSNILEPVAQSVFVPAQSVNQQLAALGQAPTEIFTKTFIDAFVLMGGCGTILCLIAAIFLVGNYKNQRRLARLSFIPVLFNINELIVFGIPIVLNPVYLIPFLCVPIILTVISFLAMFYGLVPYTCNNIEWTTPIFLSGYTSTNSISGSLLQLFNLGLGTLCYIPFVKLAESVSDVQGQNNINKIYNILRQSEERGIGSTLLTRYDEIGNIARFLAADLEHDLEKNKVTLYYQPQVDYEGNVFGVEALLRWNHDSYGYIYPPLVIALAEEAQMIDKLGNLIFEKACCDMEEIYKLAKQDITVSVNVSAVQLENEFFIDNIKEIMRRHGITPENIRIEITEQLALANSNRIISNIIAIKEFGIKLAMDDFGMGHSSLIYLKEYDFDIVKLDGSLVKEIIHNNNCRNIISTIVTLGKSLNYSVIAEYVEEPEQRRILHELGCDQYQGYLYSKAIPYTELIEYICLANK